MKKLLIANRGEIALRIIRAAKELGIATVSVYAEPDRGSAPTRLADEAICLGGSRAAETYLDIDKILAAATQSGADAVHPGYGFLAENAEFAQRVSEAGLKFIGPAPETINLMGDKHRAREFAIAQGVPVLPGTAPDLDESKLKQEAERIGYPLLVKAVAGGSGRGMRLVENAAALGEGVDAAKREASAGFGNESVILERFLENPRHIEVQVFGDGKGKAVHFGERECSIQRRHQKLVEESPAVNLSIRDEICKSATMLAAAVNYAGAGTVEFLVKEKEFFFLEMNTRIQVEHPVTEEVFKCDLLKLQLLDDPLPQQEEIKAQGHSIEFRVYAEDPSQGFKPQTGQINYISRPGGPGFREDGWLEAGALLSPYFDSLICKIIISGNSRQEALGRAKAYLDNFVVDGPVTTLGFHRWLMQQSDFLEGNVDVSWLERNYNGEIVANDCVGPLHVPKNTF